MKMTKKKLVAIVLAGALVAIPLDLAFARGGGGGLVSGRRGGSRVVTQGDEGQGEGHDGHDGLTRHGAPPGLCARRITQGSARWVSSSAPVGPTQGRCYSTEHRPFGVGRGARVGPQHASPYPTPAFPGSTRRRAG